MQRDRDTDEDVDNSTDLQDTSGSSSDEASESMEDSDELNRKKMSNRGRPRKSAYEMQQNAFQHGGLDALFGRMGPPGGGALADFEEYGQEEIETPLTRASTERAHENEEVTTGEALKGGRVMLPLSPFLKPKIHFPLAAKSPLDDTGLGDGNAQIAMKKQRYISNQQYINKGLASTLQYQMYINNLILMNRINLGERRAVGRQAKVHPGYGRMGADHPERLGHAFAESQRSSRKAAMVARHPKKAAESDEESDEYIEPARRKPRRSASQRELVAHREEEEEELDVEVEEDPVERLLGYEPAEDMFYVKYRGKSYLHCEWTGRDTLTTTKMGEMRVRRFLKNEDVGKKKDEEYFDPAFVIVERIIAEDEEEVDLKQEPEEEEGEAKAPGAAGGTIKRKVYLVKWRKLAYESSTFEYYEHVCDCEGFEEAHGDFVARHKKAAFPFAPPAWRPSRDKISAAPAVFKDGRELREYQKEGVGWLLNKWMFRQSCILADEMGLGKTVQSVALIDSIITLCGQKRPALVVAPLSTLPHWEREFAGWTNLRVLVYHGSQPAREIMFDFEFRKSDGALLFDVLLTTYEMAIAGIDHLGKVVFGVSVFDEAHRLKNSKSKATQTLRQIEVDHKVLLSGTPLQNNLGELWSLLNFIDPERFPSLKEFLGTYKVEEEEDVERLRLLLRPIMLRRMKDDVESIPVKEETIVTIPLTMIQKGFYRAILERNLEFLTAGGSSAPNLLNVMMELRKCCIHPYLIAGAEEQILTENGFRAAAEKDAKREDELPYTKETKAEYFRILIESSGKLMLLDKLLAKLFGSHKVLIFSQMTRCLDLLAEFLQYRDYSYERIDGTVRGDLRQAAIDRFTADPTSFVFLLCTRAGGVGINLTAADTVVIFDSDWNPQNDLQAQARCHRIGQTSEVKIFRLVTQNTYEREMFDKASLKLGLEKAILHKEKDASDGCKKGRVESLLKKGAYGVLMEADEENQKFCEEGIDQILEGRTKVVRQADQGGNIFSKVSFQVDDEIDDPDFWDNLLVRRKAADVEGRLRRQMRKIIKEGAVSEGEELAMEALLEKSAQDKLKATVHCLELRGIERTHAEFPKSEKAVRAILRRAIESIESEKQREDFKMGLEWAFEEKKKKELGKDEKEAETRELFEGVNVPRLLFRCQIGELLKEYEKSRDATEIDWKQWTRENDDQIVLQTRRNGYGLYHMEVDEKERVGLLKSEKGREQAVYKGRTREELSSRIRKIVAAINKKEDVEEEKVSVSSAIEVFGRPTLKNRESIIKMFRGRNIISEMTNTIESIETNMKKRLSRRGGFDPELARVLTTRISLFDRLGSLEEEQIPNLRKGPGLLRGWNRDKDLLLIQMVLCDGIGKDVAESLGISEEAIIKRVEAILRNVSSKAGEESGPQE